ncbi:unnamed protein product [Ectocarpus sp. 12 AP-2014]
MVADGHAVFRNRFAHLRCALQCSRARHVVLFSRQSSCTQEKGDQQGERRGREAGRAVMQQSGGTLTRRTGMNLMEMALATVPEWLSWNLGQFWNQTTRKTPRIARTFVDTDVVPSRDCKGSRNNRDQETASNNLGPSRVRTRAISSRRHRNNRQLFGESISQMMKCVRLIYSGASLRTFGYRVMLLVAIAAIKLDSAEGTLLFDLPSGWKCAWFNLSHPAQYAALVMTLGCLYGVNRLFDRLDRAMYARLSCATRNWMQQRREALGV